MKIGIDCRMYGPKHTGIGRYVQNLVEELLLLDRENEYVLFFRKADNDSSLTRYQYNNIAIIEADIEHYSLKEQVLFPGIIKKARLDLMHFTHFNVPIFYFGRYVVTIHDLIKHTSKGMATTTRTPWLYWLKYLGYQIVFWLAVKRAWRIFVPSKTVKDELQKKYSLNSEKIVVTYEGIDNRFKVQSFDGVYPEYNRGAQDKSSKFKIAVQRTKLLEEYGIKKPFLLYVGSVYPHKNIERLIRAVKLLNQSPITPPAMLLKAKRAGSHQPPITLVVVCARSVFWERLNKLVIKMGVSDFINFAGFVPDEELAVLYQETEAFVFPTLSEGFGLPGLEAMAAGCPVVCSDIPVLEEIYGKAAIYFNPLIPEDIAKKIRETIEDDSKREKMIKEGELQAKRYSWQKMAAETLQVYSKALNEEY